MPWISELAQLPTPTIAMRMAFLLFIRYSAWILRPLGRGGNAAPCSEYWENWDGTSGKWIHTVHRSGHRTPNLGIPVIHGVGGCQAETCGARLMESFVSIV